MKVAFSEITRGPTVVNEPLALHVLQQLVACGVQEVCFCPGNRNAPFYHALRRESKLRTYFWYEERSAAFFALGRTRATGRPVAVICTSGSAAGELLPAAMEAYYLGAPLLLLTADRPRAYRNTGAPQTAEQVGLFGPYAPFTADVASEDSHWLDLYSWTRSEPAHVNVCFDEPLHPTFEGFSLLDHTLSFPPSLSPIPPSAFVSFHHFFEKSHHPLVVVGGLLAEDQPAVKQFLLHLQAPVFLEGISGLREDPDLQQLRIYRTHNHFQKAKEAGYPLDGILRIGGVPTFRLWRDLEYLSHIPVCSLNRVPFPGLSGREILCYPIASFLNTCPPVQNKKLSTALSWLQAEERYAQGLHLLLAKEASSEASLFYQLSCQIPKHSLVYIGNSQPIREWDLAATSEYRGFSLFASRGVNGIDGQISTFLGLCQPNRQNWAIVGDLTALYDLAGPWILRQLEELQVQLVVMNNSGGRFFSRWVNEEAFMNTHPYTFEGLAKLWQIPYEKWEKQIPVSLDSPHRHRLIEVIPDLEASECFWTLLYKI